MRRGILGLVAAATVLLAGTGSAAAAGVTTSCAFNGTGNFNPSIGLFGGSGQFTFSGNAVCQVGGSPVLFTTGAAGDYVFTACGSGTFHGSMTVPGIGVRTFSIVFNAFQGIMFVPDESSAANIVGAVEMTPTGPDPAACVHIVNLTGTFTL